MLRLARSFAFLILAGIPAIAVASHGQGHVDLLGAPGALPAGTTDASWSVHLWGEHVSILDPNFIIPNEPVVITAPSAGCGTFAGVAPGATFTVTTDGQANAALPAFTAGPSSTTCTLTTNYYGYDSPYGSPTSRASSNTETHPLLVVAAQDIVASAKPLDIPIPVLQGFTGIQPAAQFNVSLPSGVRAMQGQVRFDYPAGCGGPGSETAVTSGGSATASSFTPPATPTRCTVTATLVQFGVSVPIEVVTFDKAGTTLSPASQMLVVQDTQVINATFRTATGDPIRNKGVVFYLRSLGNGVGSIAPLAGSTDANGVLPIRVTGTAAPIAFAIDALIFGEFSIAQAVTRTITITQVAASMPPVSSSVSKVEVAGGDGQVTVIGAELAQPLQVRIRDGSGQPLANMSVEFVLDANGPGGVFTGSNGTKTFAMTDASGLAQVVFKPTSGVGQGTVYARVFDAASQAYASVTLHFTSTFANGASTADFQDFWWNPAQSGWGFAIAQGNAGLFEVLYTYDAAGQPTWFTATNATWTSGFGSTSAGSLYSPTSSPYFAYDPSRFSIGAATSALAVAFADPDHAQLTTSVLDGGAAKALQRYVFADVAATKRGVGGLWWGGPSQNGWGLSIAEQGGALFVGWYTYDATGKPLWFSMSQGSWSGNTWSGPVFKSARSASGAVAAVATTSVGTFSIDFAGTGAGTFRFNVEGHQGSAAIQRFQF